jgi:hypothetical protein
VARAWCDRLDAGVVDVERRIADTSDIDHTINDDIEKLAGAGPGRWS